MRYDTIIIAALCASIAGIVTYAWFNNWLIIAYQPCRTHTMEQSSIDMQPITIYYALPYHRDYSTEERTIITPEQEHERAFRIIQQWLAVLDESYILDRPCTVQSVSPSPTGHILYISFDRIPCNEHDAAYAKWRIIESALQSLYYNGITTQSIHFLVHHQPIEDYHLDFTRPWPLHGFQDSLEQPQQLEHNLPHKKKLTLMLDPAGDAQSPGRIIDTCFERGLTLQCCQQLKQRIEQKMSNIRVVLTRFPGERLDPLQNAAFTNRLGADLCISIHLYPSKHIQPYNFIYYFLYHPETDFWMNTHSQLQLLGYDQAHVPYVHQSRYIAHMITQSLQEQLSSHLAIGPIIGIPFRPLIGMHVPAIAIEAGLREEHDWQAYLDYWANSICKILQIYQAT